MDNEPEFTPRDLLTHICGGVAKACLLYTSVTPPAYTGLAPVFLKRDHPAVSVPDGSHLALNLTGGASVPELRVDTDKTPFTSLDQTSFQTDRVLTRDSRVAVVRDGKDLAEWDISVIPDKPPVAWWTEPPGPSEAAPRVRLPWSASDDYEMCIRDRAKVEQILDKYQARP